MIRREPCAVCGGIVTADTLDPVPGVALHNAGPAHRAYRQRVVAVDRTREWRRRMRADLERIRLERWARGVAV